MPLTIADDSTGGTVDFARSQEALASSMKRGRPWQMSEVARSVNGEKLLWN